MTWYAANSGVVKAIGGIYRRDPISESWSPIADHEDIGGFWSTIHKLHTHPIDPDVLFAATSDGLYRTNNVNSTAPDWTKVLLPEPTDDPTYGAYEWKPWQHVYDMEMEPENGDHLYVTVRFEGELEVFPGQFEKVHLWRILQSQDGGRLGT